MIETAERHPRGPAGSRRGGAVSAATALACLCACACIGCGSSGRAAWSIGVYSGTGLFDLAPAPGATNPVLTAADVTDVPAELVADPFMVHQGGTWHMFFEVMNARTRQGDIALATSADGMHWTYGRIVLDEPFHLSYPCVFKCDGRWYMVPESHQAGGVRLYRADAFPHQWSFVSTLLRGSWMDPTVFRHDGKWWMFAARGDAFLHLFHADHPAGPWREHPRSPVVRGDPHVARPAGRTVVLNGTPVRFAQDDLPVYGSRVVAFEITRLTTEEYAEREVAAQAVLTASGLGWNARRMHHVDAHRLAGGGWLACVDGYGAKTAPPR